MPRHDSPHHAGRTIDVLLSGLSALALPPHPEIQEQAEYIALSMAPVLVVLLVLFRSWSAVPDERVVYPRHPLAAAIAAGGIDNLPHLAEVEPNEVARRAAVDDDIAGTVVGIGLEPAAALRTGQHPPQF